MRGVATLICKVVVLDPFLKKNDFTELYIYLCSPSCLSPPLQPSSMVPMLPIYSGDLVFFYFPCRLDPCSHLKGWFNEPNLLRNDFPWLRIMRLLQEARISMNGCAISEVSAEKAAWEVRQEGLVLSWGRRDFIGSLLALQDHLLCPFAHPPTMLTAYCHFLDFVLFFCLFVFLFVF